MDSNNLKLMIFRGSFARRVLLRGLAFAVALSIVPLLQIISGPDPQMLYTLTASADCALESGFSASFMFPGTMFFSKVWGSFGSLQCKEDGNLTTGVVRALMGKKLLSYNAKALCVGEDSVSAVMALRDLGFSKVNGVYRHPFFSINHKKFVYELDYEDSSYDFVLSRDSTRVSVPALLVLEIERVLRPGGIGAILIGLSGSNSASLIRSATPVSSLLKASVVIYVDDFNEFTLVVFEKKLENTTYFEQYRLPADCPSMTNNKAVLNHIEPLMGEKPMEFEKSIAYLPKFVNVSTKQCLVYIDIGASKHMNLNVTNWFFPSYPLDHQAFDVYFVDHNSSVMKSYVKRPGINFVYYPGLAENRITSSSMHNASIDSDSIDDSDPFVENEEFDFHLWFTDTVQYADFVVLKMNARAAELQLLSDLFESGIICFIDELFLNCSDSTDSGRAANGGCMGLFKSLRRAGVYAPPLRRLIVIIVGVGFLHLAHAEELMLQLWFNAELAEIIFVDTTPFVKSYFLDPEDHTYDWRGIHHRKHYVTNLLKNVERALRESSAKWKIVVGHHAIRSIGHHGDTPELATHLLSILKEQLLI
ncbi:hypothetical protein F3Y22_tig00110450pilonHSYRG00880 [Hibiscus syriacus]|uniref:DUF7870 domain-containing protein n=1 Tax=Hibiscus syriacus TaxID=106335 RepID=A0A6A3AL34_HIBSY|nr:hypothetical protein F3Y22_tig00110450pilonHSYRG00880 [Hibiscus syriacus]